MKKGPIIISSKDSSLKRFFRHLGSVFEVKNEKFSKAFWSTSSLMAPYYFLLFTTSSWLISKGIKKKRQKTTLENFFFSII